MYNKFVYYNKGPANLRTKIENMSDPIKFSRYISRYIELFPFKSYLEI